MWPMNVFFFEKFQEGGEIEVQRFLIPVQVELPFDQAEAVREAIPALLGLGVELEPFGANAFFGAGLAFGLGGASGPAGV
jgi:DNA mismatch repair ATPase MutL